MRIIQRKLTPETGMYLTWAGPANPHWMELTSRIVFTMGQVFRVHIPYFFYTQTYGASYMVSMGTSRAINPLGESPQAIDEYLAKQHVQDLLFYDGVTHYNMFHIPKNTRSKLADQNRSITLADPYYISGFSRE